MEKENIDKYFSENIKLIENFVKNSLIKYNLFREDYSYFVSEIYFHVVKYKDEIENEIILKKYISTFLTKNCQWHSSSIREMGKLTKKTTLKTVEFVYEKCNLVEEKDVLNLFGEFDLFDYDSINELYYQSLSSLEKKVIWEIYFIHKRNSTGKFAKHIGRSRTVAEKYIKSLKKDLLEFYNNYKLQHP